MHTSETVWFLGWNTKLTTSPISAPVINGGSYCSFPLLPTSTVQSLADTMAREENKRTQVAAHFDIAKDEEKRRESVDEVARPVSDGGYIGEKRGHCLVKAMF